MSVELLDCTLRDGTHVNSGNFGYQKIIKLIKGLSETNLDIVEIGFLKDVKYNKDFPYYPKIENAYEVLEKAATGCKTRFALMARADQYDLNNLSDCNGKIDLIRVAFYYDYFEKAIEFAKKVKDKGYNITLNLINTPGNDIKDLIKLAKAANKVMPEILTIVDTFGVLYREELKTILENYNSILNPGIKIGLHVHENLALAFSLAQYFIYYIKQQRDIVVDSSIMGMGRTPGNLCSELITNYMNKQFNTQYNLPVILNLIDDIILPVRKKYQWGYSPSYFLSADYRVHRSYSEYLEKQNISLVETNKILKQIDKEHAKKFDRAYIDTIINKKRGGK